MKTEKMLDFCKYYDNGRCPYKVAYEQMIDILIAQGRDMAGLQPRCPRDAQRNKRGTLSCICERSERL